MNELMKEFYDSELCEASRSFELSEEGKEALKIRDDLYEQLEKVISEIETEEIKLKELKNTKKELEEQIKSNRIKELDEFISSRGLSIEDVKELLEKE